MKEIFIICWEGRNCDTEIWDTYPCFEYGFYTTYNKAQAKADELNNAEPRDYDAEAEDIPTYVVQVVNNGEEG